MESKISWLKNIVSPYHKFYSGRPVQGILFMKLLESTDNFGGQQGVNSSATHVILASYKMSLSLTIDVLSLAAMFDASSLLETGRLNISMGWTWVIQDQTTHTIFLQDIMQTTEFERHG